MVSEHNTPGVAVEATRVLFRSQCFHGSISEAGLTLEAGQPLSVFGESRGQHLDGCFTLELRIGGPVDRAEVESSGHLPLRAVRRFVRRRQRGLR